MPPPPPPTGYGDAGYPPQFFPGQQPWGAPQQELPQLGCPICGGAFQVSPEMVGQQMGCPHCHNAVTIPDLFGGIPQGIPTGTAVGGPPMLGQEFFGGPSEYAPPPQGVAVSSAFKKMMLART